VRNKYIILIGNPERRIPLERPRRRYEGNIEIYVQNYAMKV
jgi:hypothetical protein